MNALFQLKKRFPLLGFFNPRALVTLLLCGTVCLTVTGALPAFFRAEAQTKVSHPAAAELTFAERVAYQRVIEDVYWRHRIWPRNGGENPNPKPSLDAVMSQVQLEKKVTDYLQKSQALDYWQQPITAYELQAEMDRMAQHTKQPGALRELFAALGNDPFVIAECLARPLLAERLLTHSADEQIKQTNRTYEQVVAAADSYSLPSIAEESGCDDNTWTAISTTNAPDGRHHHTAVWTGSEMIIWGGEPDDPYVLLNTGGRYDPSTDSWTTTTTMNAPSPRWGHTAVWTGTEMIVWGGDDAMGGHLNTGGTYNPGTDTWTATSITGAPAGRLSHTAVWTGNEMVVWGGSYLVLQDTNTGGRYNPNTNSWTGTSTVNAPAARRNHSAVWTGSEMIVWGGSVFDPNIHRFNSGGRYNPDTNSWTATNTTNAPAVREIHTAVWTGSEMIVWGGSGEDPPPPYYGHNFLNTGGRYDPSTDGWTATSTTNVPSARGAHTAVWTGNQMIVWGGTDNDNDLNSGGRYNPNTNSWKRTSTTDAPAARRFHTAVWTGSEMIVWGGLAYGNPSTNTGGTYCSQSLESQLGNISTRAFVQTGDNVIIGGFMVQGTQTKRVIIRAIGPELTQYGVPDALANPTLELHNGTGALIASNDNWQQTIIGGIITSDQSSRYPEQRLCTG